MGAAESTEAGAQQQEEGSYPSALVIIGPSGVGKGTLITKLMQSSDRFGFSCSHTTREPRADEKDGQHYWFTDKATMEAEISDGQFLEFAVVHDNIYGTSIRAVRDVASQGKCCILDIDVQGARQVRKAGLRAIFVFIAPPSMEELEKRLRGRATEEEAAVQSRVEAARQEIASIQEEGLYDHVIYNDNLEEASQQLAEIAERALNGETGATAPSSEAQAAAEEAAPNGSAAPAQLEECEALLPRSAEDSAEGQQAQRDEEAGVLEDSAVQPVGLERWRGKVALVTGASAGIGWAVCEALAAAGLRVVAVARRRERLEELQQRLVASGVPIADFLPVVCDITKEAEVVALPLIILKRWPDAGVDILVNNAGLGRNNASLWEGSTASWVEMISTNVLGVCMCTREVLQDMTRREQYGHIINISSMSGHRVPNAASGGAFYAATKHALRALTEGLRQEARARKTGLRVTAISPGMVETEFYQVTQFNDRDRVKAGSPYEDFQCLKAEDIAQAVVYALSAPDHMDVNDILIRPTQQLT